MSQFFAPSGVSPMFTHRDRADHRLHLDGIESLEGRQLAAITAISAEAVIGAPPTRLGGNQAVTVSGTVRADAPLGTTANALLFDEYNGGVPTVFPVKLADRGDGTYTYSIPLTLSTKHRAGDRDGHQYAVGISVQDKEGSATTATNFSLPAARTVVARPAHHRPDHAHALRIDRVRG